MLKINLFVKRIMDFFTSLIGIIVLLPILSILIILIKLDSKGPVFFKQERLGQHGKIFNIYKFRTMIENAENIGSGLTVRSEKDSRITKVGVFLRRTSLDEIPQLFNVLKGEMSLVGPRPPVIYFPYRGYNGYPNWAKKRFQFKPGITGLSQITVRNSVPWNDRIRVDLEYIEKFNIYEDIKIILKTFVKVMSPESVYLSEDVSNGNND